MLRSQLMRIFITRYPEGYTQEGGRNNGHCRQQQPLTAQSVVVSVVVSVVSVGVSTGVLLAGAVKVINNRSVSLRRYNSSEPSLLITA